MTICSMQEANTDIAEAIFVKSAVQDGIIVGP